MRMRSLLLQIPCLRVSLKHGEKTWRPTYKSSSKNGGAGNAAWRSTSMLGAASANDAEEASNREQKSALAVGSRPDVLDMLMFR